MKQVFDLTSPAYTRDVWRIAVWDPPWTETDCHFR